MTTGITAWIDGAFIDCGNATVPLLSHSFSRGSAIFEVMSITPTQRGPAFFCLEEHIERFFFSAEQTYMNLPYTKEELKEALFTTARKNSVQNGFAKFYAYYPDIDLGTTPSDNISAAVFCVDYSHPGIRRKGQRQGISVGISKYRKLHPETTAVHAKIAGNYVNGYLARMEVKKRGFDDVLMLDTNGYIAEGPTANILLINGSSVETPGIENVLPGITRRVIMKILDDMGYPEKETHIRPEDLGKYEEAFFSGTLNPVQPITRIEDKVFACPGPMTGEIMNRMNDILSGKVPQYENLLSLIP